MGAGRDDVGLILKILFIKACPSPSEKLKAGAIPLGKSSVVEEVQPRLDSVHVSEEPLLPQESISQRATQFESIGLSEPSSCRRCRVKRSLK
jgi:hypothetical protein